MLLAIKCLTAVAIVGSLIYLNWWLTNVRPALMHQSGSDPFGPWVWSLRNVTNHSVDANQVTFNPNDYDGALFGRANRTKPVTVVTFAHTTEFTLLRKFVGAIHFWDPGRRIAVWTTGFTGDQLAEARLFLWTDIHLMTGHMQHAKDESEDRERDQLGTHRPDQDNAPWRTQLVLAVSKHYPDALIVPLRFRLARRLCGVDAVVRDGQKIFALNRCAHHTKPWPPGLTCVPVLEYFTEMERDGNQECKLMLRYNNTHEPQPLPAANGKPYWCIAVATYSRHGNDVADQALLSVMLPSLGPSIKDSLERFNFALYVGTQVDRVWDDPHNRHRLLTAMAAILDPLGVQLRLHRYPLNDNLIDIVWKYNNLIMQAYADGCQYIYQFSDDVKFDTPGWADAFAYVLKQNGDFGTVGPNDTFNPQRMTLGASGRTHLEIQGWFWPPRLKNWWADNYIQEVYGEYSVPLQSVEISNTQKFGRRYGYCMHGRIEREEIARSLKRAWRWSLRHRPELADYLRARADAYLLKLHTRDRLLNQKPDLHRDLCAKPAPNYLTWDELDYSPYEPPYLPPELWSPPGTTDPPRRR